MLKLKYKHELLLAGQAIAKLHEYVATTVDIIRIKNENNCIGLTILLPIIIQPENILHTLWGSKFVDQSTFLPSLVKE